MSNSIKWKYKEELKNEEVFSSVEKISGRKVSPNLKSLILEANGATPDKYRIKVEDTEKVFGAVLSFNEGSSDNVFTALDVIGEKKLIPFGIDPFGNYFCLKAYDIVVIWEHETNKFQSTKMSLGTFLSNLY